ncbi:alpha/beta-hydrolase [Meredithblackwellia eburnea MCA 4105]
MVLPSLLLTFVAGCGVSLVRGQSDPWQASGADSLFFHQEYHGRLVMASYGDYNTTCPQSFTQATLQRQYPGNTNAPFTVVGTWGPTPIYRSKGYIARVPEMNKIVMVFSDVYGWQEFNQSLVPFNGVGCDGTCMVHKGALEAWREVQNATNNMAAVQANRGNLIFSSVGHGFGGMIVQVGALELRQTGGLWSCYTMGSPPVFNEATATRYASLFTWGGDVTASQRIVSYDDSIPRAINVSAGGYSQVLTGVHLYGSNPQYGPDYEDCENDANAENCLGGETEADHYWYYTDYGSCGEAGFGGTPTPSKNQAALAAVQAAYNATATLTTSTISSTLTSSTLSSSPTNAAPTTSFSAPISTTSATASSTATNGVSPATTTFSPLSLTVAVVISSVGIAFF